MYLILLLVFFAILGVFSVQNEATQTFHLLGYVWTLPAWVPTVAASGIVSVLLLLRMSHAGIGQRLADMGHGRALDEHRDTIDGLRAENGRLREQLAAARGELRGANSGSRPSVVDSVRSMVGQDRSNRTTA